MVGLKLFADHPKLWLEVEVLMEACDCRYGVCYFLYSLFMKRGVCLQKRPTFHCEFPLARLLYHDCRFFPPVWMQ